MDATYVVSGMCVGASLERTGTVDVGDGVQLRVKRCGMINGTGPSKETVIRKMESMCGRAHGKLECVYHRSVTGHGDVGHAINTREMCAANTRFVRRHRNEAYTEYMSADVVISATGSYRIYTTQTDVNLADLHDAIVAATVSPYVLVGPADAVPRS